MDDGIRGFVEDVIGRLHGPLTLRLVLQPMMALLIAVKDGLDDARAGRPPYFVALLTDSVHRQERIRDGWASIGKLFGMACGLDAVYQLIVFRWFYLDEALFMALLLAVVPYVLIRGAADRLIRRNVRTDA